MQHGLNKLSAAEDFNRAVALLIGSIILPRISSESLLSKWQKNGVCASKMSSNLASRSGSIYANTPMRWPG